MLLYTRKRAFLQPKSSRAFSASSYTQRLEIVESFLHPKNFSSILCFFIQENFFFAAPNLPSISCFFICICIHLYKDWKSSYIFLHPKKKISSILCFFIHENCFFCSQIVPEHFVLLYAQRLEIVELLLHPKNSRAFCASLYMKPCFFCSQKFPEHFVLLYTHKNRKSWSYFSIKKKSRAFSASLYTQSAIRACSHFTYVSL